MVKNGGVRVGERRENKTCRILKSERKLCGVAESLGPQEDPPGDTT